MADSSILSSQNGRSDERGIKDIDTIESLFSVCASLSWRSALSNHSAIYSKIYGTEQDLG